MEMSAARESSAVLTYIERLLPRGDLTVYQRNSPQRLSVLRLTTVLSRRLSPVNDAVLAGRLLLFLAQLLPLNDRSGVNAMHNFNHSHATDVEDVQEVDLQWSWCELCIIKPHQQVLSIHCWSIQLGPVRRPADAAQGKSGVRQNSGIALKQYYIFSVCFLQGALDSSGQLVDVAFYRTFWGLQSAFQKPYDVIEPGQWHKASYLLGCLLCTFV